MIHGCSAMTPIEMKDRWGDGGTVDPAPPTIGSMSETVALNFAEPIALLPLHGVVMLPHSALPLHVFEPHYRQMMRDALAGGAEVPPKPIAIAAIEPSAPATDRTPPVREAVCIGHIVKHRHRGDGSFDLILQGLCRAAIERIEEPEGDRLYRRAILRPLDDPSAKVPGLKRMRREMRGLLAGLRLQNLQCVRSVMGWIDRPELSHQGAIELIAFAVIKNEEVRYQVLAEADPYRRARIIWEELERTDRLIAKAQSQVGEDPPRGVSWN
ncbi:MAG: hypothetical protein EXS03_02510 [Phycisphaerales bacterium]|nr:hypothetical protein [Phycisphaerales bacterium]